MMTIEERLEVPEIKEVLSLLNSESFPTDPIKTALEKLDLLQKSNLNLSWMGGNGKNIVVDDDLINKYIEYVLNAKYLGIKFAKIYFPSTREFPVGKDRVMACMTSYRWDALMYTMFDFNHCPIYLVAKSFPYFARAFDGDILNSEVYLSEVANGRTLFGDDDKDVFPMKYFSPEKVDEILQLVE